MGKTKIEYADYVSNPLQAVDIVTGKRGTHCEKPDPDGTCRGCWAEVLNTRGGPQNLRFGTGLAYTMKNRSSIRWERHNVEMIKLANMNRQRVESEKFPGNPRVVFTNDTYDLFQPSISDGDRDWVFDCYDKFTNVTLLVQTTYVSAMRKYLTARYAFGMPPHYVIGMSAGTQRFLDQNYRHLVAVPAVRRYLICEPLLERLEIRNLEIGAYEPGNESPFRKSFTDFLSWVIVGGESGSEARPFDVDWLRPFIKYQGHHSLLIKQLGAKPYDSKLRWFRPGSVIVPVDSDWQPRRFVALKANDPEEWDEEFRIREFPTLEGK